VAGMFLAGARKSRSIGSLRLRESGNLVSGVIATNPCRQTN
jgi:hypothetical protein